MCACSWCTECMPGCPAWRSTSGVLHCGQRRCCVTTRHRCGTCAGRHKCVVSATLFTHRVLQRPEPRLLPQPATCLLPRNDGGVVAVTDGGHVHMLDVRLEVGGKVSWLPTSIGCALSCTALTLGLSTQQTTLDGLGDGRCCAALCSLPDTDGVPGSYVAVGYVRLCS